MTAMTAAATTASASASATETETTISSTAHSASFILLESVVQSLAKPSHFPRRRHLTGLHGSEHSGNVTQAVEGDA